MSMTRKVLKLGHGIFPYAELSQKGISRYEVLRAVVEFFNDFWDDVYCLSRIGLLRSPRVQLWSETWANRAWMTGIIMDLHVLMHKRAKMAKKLNDIDARFLEVPGVKVTGDLNVTDQKARAEAFWIDVSILKLLADFGFCGMIFENRC